MFQAQPATSVLNNCVNNGEVICLTGAAGVSGILGQGNCTHLLSNCTNTAKVSSSNTNDTTYISGICCYNDAYYYNCTNTGDLEGHPSSTTGVHDTDGSMAGIMAGFYNGTSKRSGIVNCYNKGNMINHNQACRDISNIAAGIGDIEMKDMTFATTEELAQAIVTAIGQYSCVRLTNVTVTDHSGVLEIPNGINEITSNLPICSSLKLNTSKNYLNTNVPDLNITVDSDAYSHVFINCAGSNNTITINQGAKIGTVTVSGANSKIINNGTAGAICINEAATYGENNGTCTSVSFNEYNTQLVGYNKEFINHGTIKTTATRDNAHVINSIGEGTNKFVFKNYGTVEYEMTPEAETAKKAPGYLYLFYNHADNEVYNYPGAVVKTDRNKSLGYSFALHGNLTYHHAQSNDDGITFAGELVKFSSMYNPKITFTADL